MYELILEERLATILATVLLAMLASSLVGAGRLWLRGLMYSLAPAMGAAFYVVAFLAQPAQNKTDLIAGLLFETTVLAIFFQLFKRLKQYLIFIRAGEAAQLLKWTIALKLLIVLPTVTASGFGIFSDGSRIDYLYANSWAKYFTYAGSMITTVQAVFLASLITTRGYLGALGWAVITINFSLSVVAGSKGGVFLWLLAVVSLIDYGRARIPTYKIILALLIGTSAVLLSSLIVAQFFGVELGDFFRLASSRFFLVNDARALALDLRTQQSSSLSFFSEAFRSLGNMLGMPPQNDPLGVVLYSEGLSVTNGNGANTSFMALATYYFPIGFALLPAIAGMLGAVFLALIGRLSVKIFSSPVRRTVIISIWMACLGNYSQDFLAFQVLLPLAVLFIFFILIYHPKWYAKRYETTPKLQHGRC